MVTSTVSHLPFPAVTAEQRDLLVRWLHAAASRESYLQLKATRTQDRIRHSIRANAFRDAIGLAKAEVLTLPLEPAADDNGAT